MMWGLRGQRRIARHVHPCSVGTKCQMLLEDATLLTKNRVAARRNVNFSSPAAVHRYVNKI